MNTVIQRLQMEDAGRNEFYMKRDDLLPFSIGGNKVRIAEAFFADMECEGADTMLIYGSRHSNLCRVLSDLCASRGKKCVMICSHEQGEADVPTNNTKLIEWTGTKMIHCGKTEIAETVERAMEEIRSEGGVPYYIYGNKFGKGREGVAARAYAEAYQEILRQEQKLGTAFDYIFCPSGTGATQTGLICGHLMAGDTKKIVGIMISSREKERAYQVIEEGALAYFKEQNAVCKAEAAGKECVSGLQNDICKSAVMGEPCEEELLSRLSGEICLLDQYRQEGYGKYDARIEACIRSQYLKNGIPLDPIYTAKAFWGMTEYVREAGIQDSKILFLHTGGTPLFFDYLEGGAPDVQ